MSASHDYGPLSTYEVTWSSGHVERIQAHQVLIPQPDLFGLGSGNRQWMFHGEIDGHWNLILVAAPEDIRGVRNLTHAPDTLGGES